MQFLQYTGFHCGGEHTIAAKHLQVSTSAARCRESPGLQNFSVGQAGVVMLHGSDSPLVATSASCLCTWAGCRYTSPGPMRSDCVHAVPSGTRAEEQTDGTMLVRLMGRRSPPTRVGFRQ